MTRATMGLIMLAAVSCANLTRAELVLNVDFQPGPTGGKFSRAHAGVGALPDDGGTLWNVVAPPVDGYASAWGSGGNFSFTGGFTSEPLYDSGGRATPVTITVHAGAPLGTTFAVNPENTWAYGHVAADAAALMGDYLIAPGGGTNSVVISNLVAGARYTLYLYGAGDQNYHQTTFVVGGHEKSTAGVPHDRTHDLTAGMDYVVFEDVEAAGGVIAIGYVAAGESRDGNFNGLQLKGARPGSEDDRGEQEP